MRLPEISKAPCHGADKAEESQPFSQAQEAGNVHVLQRPARFTAAAEHHHQRHDHQRQHHDDALNEIGKADGKKPADHRIGQHDPCRDDDAPHVIAHHVIGQQAGKRRLEQLAACDKAGGGVDGEEHHDDDGRDYAQGRGAVGEAVGEELRDGQRVVVSLGLFAQARGDDEPVDHSAREQSDTDPRFDQPGGVKRTGQAEQQPARHIRSAGG